MCAKRVFGKARLTREEREAERRIREATKDRPSAEELDRRLGPGRPIEDMDAFVFRSSLGHQIGIAREDAGLTRAGLAKLVGAEDEEISRLECGAEDVTTDTLVRVLKALKLKVTIEPARPAEKKPAAEGARG